MKIFIFPVESQGQKLEAGVDLRQIQKALGHESLKTIEIYTCPGGRRAHLTDTNKFRFHSPIDNMDIRI